MNIKKIRTKLFLLIITAMFLFGACGKNEDKGKKEEAPENESRQQKETEEKSLSTPKQ